MRIMVETMRDAAAAAGPEPGGSSPLPPPDSATAAGSLLRLDRAEIRAASGAMIIGDISLAVPQGGLQSIVGPRGAGKSRLCTLVAAAGVPARGRLLLFGRDTAGLDQAQRAALRRRMGIIPQRPHLLEHLSVLDNVLLPFVVGGTADEQSRRDATELLRWIGLGDRLGLPAGMLSCGERQCAAVARALVTKPGLVIADEPLALLDRMTGRRVLRLLQELNRLGTAILVALRDPLPELDRAPVTLSVDRPAGGLEEPR